MVPEKFWDEVAGGVAQRWVDRLFSPALLFWLGGALVYTGGHPWRPWFDRLTALPEPLQLLVAFAAALVIAGSAAAGEALQRPVLRLLEGYWPGLLDGLRRRIVRRLGLRLEAKRQELNELAKRFDALTEQEQRQYSRLEEELATHPAADRLLPLRLGNCLRAAEDYPRRRYGLATGIVWPRLWLVMPEGAREELSGARARLDAAAGWFLWSGLFLLWSPWAWWVAPLAILAASVSARAILQAAFTYGILIRAGFDLFRWEVYKALRWPLPADAAAEGPAGEALTAYLWRGSRSPTDTFAAPPE